MKKVSMDFRAAYLKANGAPANDAFSAYSFDAWLLLLEAATRAKGEPGTPAYRLSLRDALVSGKEVVGTQSVYNFKPNSRYGSDERARVLVKLEKGQWKLVP
jgi:branched-chain amino acid transport system substrate-binding protein